MIDYDDLRTVLAELDRHPDVRPTTVAAAGRLRDVLEPRLDAALELADPARPATATRRRPSPTSDAAALAVLPKSGTMRMAVLAAIWHAGPAGLTDPEVAERTGIYLYSAAPRRVELVKGGWIRDSRRTRPGPRGNEVAVWVATTQADAALERASDLRARLGAAGASA